MFYFFIQIGKCFQYVGILIYNILFDKILHNMYKTITKLFKCSMRINMNFLHYLFNILPVKKNKIVLRSFSKSYGCNPKYIAQEIIKQKLPYDLVFVSKKGKNTDFPKEVKVITSKLSEYYAFSTAKVIVANSRIGNYFLKGFKKKKNQLYIQTWHGSMGIKKMEGDCDNLSSSYFKQAKIDSRNIDYLISNSKWLSDAYRSSFFYDGKIVEIGNARNDIFFSDNSKIKEKVYKYFGLEKDVNICLYAPTFRDDKTLDCYSLDYQKLLDTLKEKFGGKWVALSRMHPNLSKIKDIVPVMDNLLDGGKYSDIQELLAVSDVLITDYSSCMFDFMLSNKPVFIFATDIEKYNSDRGFYYSLDTTPFAIASNNEHLMKNISAFEQKTYKINVRKFIEEKGCADTGNAAKQCVDLIKKHIERI